MARPRKVKNTFWVKFYKNWIGYSIGKLANKYNVSKRTIWRYLK
jgi:Mor family transcriptional regulator